MAFSATGDVVTIWNGDKLEIYFVSNADCNCVYGELIPELRIVTEILLATGADTPIESLYGQAVWSASGATLTYVDAQGLWVYDLINQSIPELLIEDAMPLFVSNSGRYVGFRTQEMESEWAVVDRISPEIHIENGLVSPNEGRGIVVRDADYFEWMNNLTYFKVENCDAVNAKCQLTVDTLTYEQLGRDTFTYTGPIFDVDYEPEQGLFVLALGPQAISIGDTRYELYEHVFDLAEQIDGSIVDVQWMPSLFYRDS